MNKKYIFSIGFVVMLFMSVSIFADPPDNVKNENPCPEDTPNNTGIRIMTLGNSLTEDDRISSVETRTVKERHAYRSYLYWFLTQGDLENVNFVGSNCNGSAITKEDEPGAGEKFDTDHEGYSGTYTSQHDKSFIENILNSEDPDIILLHIGTYSLTKQPVKPAFKALQNLLGYIRDYQNGENDIITLVAGIVNGKPGHRKGEALTAKVNSYNSQVHDLIWKNFRKYKNKNGCWRFQFVRMPHLNPSDFATKTKGHQTTEDWIHPNKRGYEKMADIWHFHLTHDMVIVDFINSPYNAPFKNLKPIILKNSGGTITLPTLKDAICETGNCEGWKIDGFEVPYMGRYKPGDKIQIYSTMTIKVKWSQN